MPRRVVPNPPTPPKGNPGSPDSYLVAQQKKLVPANSRAATPPKYRGEVAHVGADSLLIAHSKKVADAKRQRAQSAAETDAERLLRRVLARSWHRCTGWRARMSPRGVDTLVSSLNARDGRPLAGAGALRSSLDGRWLGL